MDLFICTASQHSSLWLLDQDSQLVASFSNQPHNLSAEQIPQNDNLSEAALAQNVSDLLKQASLETTDLKNLLVLTGPGSFTSLRKGVNFARGLSLGLKIPLLGIPTRTLFTSDVWIPLRPRLAASLTLSEALENDLEFLQIREGSAHQISTPAPDAKVLGLKDTYHWPLKHEVQSAYRAAMLHPSDFSDVEIDYGLEVKISGKRKSQ